MEFRALSRKLIYEILRSEIKIFKNFLGHLNLINKIIVLTLFYEKMYYKNAQKLKKTVCISKAI